MRSELHYLITEKQVKGKEMVDIIATPGSPEANSYVVVAEADSYFEGRLFSDEWDTADQLTKEAAVVMATKYIDVYVNWNGQMATEEQALQWPRRFVYDRYGNMIDENIIPVWLKEAVSEFTIHLLKSDRTAETGTEGIKDFKVGPLAFEFDKLDRVRVLPEVVWSMVKRYGQRASVDFATVFRT